MADELGVAFLGDVPGLQRHVVDEPKVLELVLLLEGEGLAVGDDEDVVVG